MNLLQGFPTLDSLFDSMCMQLGKYLQEVGLISKNATSEEVFKVYNRREIANKIVNVFFSGRLSILPPSRIPLPGNGRPRYSFDPEEYSYTTRDGNNR